MKITSYNLIFNVIIAYFNLIFIQISSKFKRNKKLSTNILLIKRVEKSLLKVLGIILISSISILIKLVVCLVKLNFKQLGLNCNLLSS